MPLEIGKNLGQETLVVSLLIVLSPPVDSPINFPPCRFLFNTARPREAQNVARGNPICHGPAALRKRTAHKHPTPKHPLHLPPLETCCHSAKSHVWGGDLESPKPYGSFTVERRWPLIAHADCLPTRQGGGTVEIFRFIPNRCPLSRRLPSTDDRADQRGPASSQRPDVENPADNSTRFAPAGLFGPQDSDCGAAG